MWKLRKFCLTLFRQKFRESNVLFLLKKLLKSCFHEIVFSVRENFSFSHTVRQGKVGHFSFLFLPSFFSSSSLL